MQSIGARGASLSATAPRTSPPRRTMTLC